MGNGKRQSALLVEIIIAVLFFALSATVILDVFATAYQQSAYAAACNEAMAEAQNYAERIYANDSPEEMLSADGFLAEDGVWVRRGTDYLLRVQFMEESMRAGVLREAQITATRGDKVLFTMPCARYMPEEVSR